MKFFRAIAGCFRKYLSVSGVASRSEFWFWLLFVALFLCVTMIIDGMFIAPAQGFLPFEAEAGQPLSVAASLLLLPPTFTAAVRRLHDSALSGYWLLLAPTVIGLLPLLYFFVKGGKKGANPYKDA